MDLLAVNDLRNAFADELNKQKNEATIRLATIELLVETEANRLGEVAENLDQDGEYKDEDDLMMIRRVSNVFQLNDASSVDNLRKNLLNEFEKLNYGLQPQITNFIPLVLYRLGEIHKEFLLAENVEVDTNARASQELNLPDLKTKGGQCSLLTADFAYDHKTEGENYQSDKSQELKTDSERGFSGPPSPIKSQGSPPQADENEMIIGIAVNTVMHDNPQDFSFDNVVEYLRQIEPTMDLADENILKYIQLKCSIAIICRDSVPDADNKRE